MNNGIHGPGGISQLDNEIKRLRHAAAVRRTAWDIIKVLLILAAVMILLSSLWFPTFQIYGSNMEPTLRDGNYVISIRQTDYRPGDIIVFNYYNKLLVKRVIALGGDVINIDADGMVTVNNVALNEPYVTQKSLGQSDIEYPYTVPAGHLFVMGDNRTLSADSRVSAVGPVSMEQVTGKVVFRLWPLSGFGFVN